MVAVQLGARDHYGFARSWHRAGVCEALVTDFWWDGPLVPPGELGRRFRGRFHPDLKGLPVRHANRNSAFFEWRLRRRDLDPWSAIIARNRFFQQEALKALKSLPPARQPRVLFAYSYAARELFQWARQQGWKTILGQIDPGPLEDRILARLRREYPRFREKRKGTPTAYFEGWREEIDLADAIVVNSSWSENALRQEGVPASQLHRIAIPYENSGKPRPREVPGVFSQGRPLRLLFLGQINLRKGIVELLEALTALKKEPVELHLVGPLRVDIPESFRSLAAVKYHGNVPRASVRSFLGEADYFVFPTHSDGFGLTQVEALAMGLPVMSSRCCGEVVRDGENGRVLEAVTADAILAAVREVLADPSLLQEWSRACRIPSFCEMGVVGRKLTHLLEAL